MGIPVSERVIEAQRLMRNYLIENPHSVEEVARYTGKKAQTVLGWKNGARSSGGEVSYLQMGFLRLKKVLPPMKLGDSPTMAEVLEKAISEKHFGVDELAKKFKTQNQGVLRWISGDSKPVGIIKLRLEWFLRDRKIYDFITERNYSAGALLLVKAICEQGLDIDKIAKKLAEASPMLSKNWPHGIQEWVAGRTTPWIDAEECIINVFGEPKDVLMPAQSESPVMQTTSPSAADQDEIVQKLDDLIEIMKAAMREAISPRRAPRMIETMIVDHATVLEALLKGFLHDLSMGDGRARIEILKSQAPKVFAELINHLEALIDYEAFQTWKRERRG